MALDLINAFGTLSSVFSIDELPMWIYAVDGDYIEPQLVQAIDMAMGDRYSILVRLDVAGDYTMRVAARSAVQMLVGTATLVFRAEDQQPFNRSSIPYIDDIGQNATEGVVRFNQDTQKAYPPSPVPPSADQLVRLELASLGSSLIWGLNGSTYSQYLSDRTPLLFDPDGRDTDNLTITTLNDTWVDILFVQKSFPVISHPIHKHGSKMYLLGAGVGDFIWASVDEAVAAVPESFNLITPPRRDSFSTPGSPSQEPTWMVIRYHVSNPGAWLLHCHVEAHQLGGMTMVILDGKDAWPEVPNEYLSPMDV